MAAIVPAGRGGGDHDDYKSIQSEEEQSLIPKADEQATAPSPTAKKKKKKKKKKVSLWKLLANWNFLFFFVNCLVPFGIAVWWFMMQPDASIPYVVSGLVGISVCVSGYRTFNQLMQVIHNVNIFETNNNKFRSEHGKMRAEVGRIKTANKQLKSTEKRLRGAIGQNKENLKNFREVQDFMKTLDVKDFQSVANKANVIGKKWREELISQERDMLNIVFGRYEMAHQDQLGMTKKEFDEFSEQLPDAYKERFARLGTFEKLANDRGRLDFADFELVLDVFAQMVVDDVDIELEIVKEENMPESGLMSHASTQSAMSDASLGGSESEEEEEEQGQGKKMGFLDKLKSWRGHRKEASNVSRQLRIKSTTPISEDGSSPGLHGFDMFGMLSGGKKKKGDADGGDEQEEKQKMGNTLSPQNVPASNKAAVKGVPSKPKPVKSMSTLEALDENDLDDEEIDDEDINAYMAKKIAQSPVDDADSPLPGADEAP